MLCLALALALTAAASEPDTAVGEDEAWAWEEEAPRLDLVLWGGQAWTDQESGLRSEQYGAEAAWRFDAMDVGLFGGCYGLRRQAAGGALETFFAPVYLLRLGQRFETRTGLTANFTFGAGALKDVTWRSWFQVALGARMAFGPAFVAGELAFESENFLRLALGLGVSLF